ncbi:MAG TPA: MarR family transcriptional regulator [Candidatus Acidoferrales bacterium]|nr:MarR family transcriptional regulator [Candidatus Acidoferrales bacterium]
MWREHKTGIDMRQVSVTKFDIGRALSDAFRRWNKLVESNLSQLELSLAEFRVLRVLESGPRLMVTLAMEQSMTAPGMTMVVDKLEDAGLVRRIRSDEDRRAINVAITGKGGEKLKRALKLHDKFIERAISGMSTQEIDSFIATLNRVLTAAEKGLQTT